MSAKNNDMQGRFRKIVIAFRVSEGESEVINRMVALSGLTKQDYLIRCTSNADIIVQGNPYVENLEEIELDDLIVLRRVLEIVIAMHDKKMAQIKVQKESPEK